jgi:RNA polymerase sigma-70 factor, ECF subfamily
MDPITEKTAENVIQRGVSTLSASDFTKAYDMYAPQIYRHVLGRVSQKEAAEDLTSQVFLKTWDYVAKGGQTIGNIRALLYRIAHNLITDHYRKRKFETVDIDALPENLRASVQAKGFEKRTEDREIVLSMERAIARLENEYRDVIVWRFIDELSIEEITAISGKTPNAVYVAVHRALKKLKKIIEEDERAMS